MLLRSKMQSPGCILIYNLCCSPVKGCVFILWDDFQKFSQDPFFLVGDRSQEFDNQAATLRRLYWYCTSLTLKCGFWFEGFGHAQIHSRPAWLRPLSIDDPIAYQFSEGLKSCRSIYSWCIIVLIRLDGCITMYLIVSLYQVCFMGEHVF